MLIFFIFNPFKNFISSPEIWDLTGSHFYLLLTRLNHMIKPFKQKYNLFERLSSRNIAYCKCLVVELSHGMQALEKTGRRYGL